jgi:hypothetical protein
MDITGPYKTDIRRTLSKIQAGLSALIAVGSAYQWDRAHRVAEERSIDVLDYASKNYMDVLQSDDPIMAPVFLGASFAISSAAGGAISYALHKASKSPARCERKGGC